MILLSAMLLCCRAPAVEHNETYVLVRKDPSFCSGVFVDANVVLTSLHCIDDQKIETDVFFFKKYVKASVYVKDELGDLVLLKLEPKTFVQRWATWRYPINEEEVNVETWNGKARAQVLSVSLLWDESALSYKAQRGDSGSPVWSTEDDNLLCILKSTSVARSERHSYCKNVSNFLNSVFFEKK
jgi:V8-like Glu-specific endopeptidase